VRELFLFLAKYIDYRLCFGGLSENGVNYSAGVCEEKGGEYNNSVNSFGTIPVQDYLLDLETSLNEVCSGKKPLAVDLLVNEK
jgi:hypothetical protein